MTPALFVELDMGAGRRPRRVAEIAWIALWTWHPGGAADAGMSAVPRRVGVVLAYPAAVLAKGAFH